MFYATQLTRSSNFDALIKDKPIANIENSELFAELVHEYDRRLEEQVRMARSDMLHELETHINVRNQNYLIVFKTNCSRCNYLN